MLHGQDCGIGGMSWARTFSTFFASGFNSVFFPLLNDSALKKLSDFPVEYFVLGVALFQQETKV